MSHFTSYSDLPAHSSFPATPASATTPGPPPSGQTSQFPQYSPYQNAFIHSATTPVGYPSHQPVTPHYMFSSIAHHQIPSSAVPQYAPHHLPAMSQLGQPTMQDHMHPYQQRTMTDPTGQIPPCNARPRITATFWEDESCTCYQVEANGICVARRSDNDMINGTKLLNVAGMTRGRRDGILKSEKIRHVVKVGPMHLKGVWIPFERALDFANKENITDLLFPLFRQDLRSIVRANEPSGSVGQTPRRQSDPRHATTIQTALSHSGHMSAPATAAATGTTTPTALVHPGTGPNSLSALPQTAMNSIPGTASNSNAATPTAPTHHSQSLMAAPTGSSTILVHVPTSSAGPLTPHGQLSGRPGGGRSHPLPSPPESTSSVSVTQGNPAAAAAATASIPNVHYDWNASAVPMPNAAHNGAIHFDTHIQSGRSVPTTPATTPPAASLANHVNTMQSAQAYEIPRQSYLPSLDSSYSMQNRYTTLQSVDPTKKPVLGSPIRPLDSSNPTGPLDGSTMKHEIVEVNPENNSIGSQQLSLETNSQANNGTYAANASSTAYDSSAGITATPVTGGPSSSYGNSNPYRHSNMGAVHSEQHSTHMSPVTGNSPGRDRSGGRSILSSQNTNSYHWNASSYATPPATSSAGAAATLASLSHSNGASAALYSNIRETPRTMAPQSNGDLYSTPVDQVHSYQPSSLKRGRDSEDEADEEVDPADSSKRRKTIRLDPAPEIIPGMGSGGYEKVHSAPGRVIAPPPRRR